MGNESRMPARDKDAFACPRCGVWAHQEWLVLQRPLEDERGNEYSERAADGVKMLAEPFTINDTWGNPSVVRFEEVGVWAMSKCGRCKEYSTWRDDRLIFPNVSIAPEAHEDMPTDAKALYQEAGEVIGISRRAGAALARATLERLLRTLDPDAGKVDLASRIDRILPKVSSSLGEMLTVIRHTGNKALHVEDEPDDVTVLVLDPEEEEIAELVFATINNLVDELITRPARARALFEKVPARVRDRVGKSATGPDSTDVV